MAVDPNLFLPAYQAGEGGPGPAIQSGLEGFVTGRKLGIQQQQLQLLAALNAARENLYGAHAQRYEQLTGAAPALDQAKIALEQARTDALKNPVGKGISDIANARLAGLVGRNSADITRNKGIIELGRRIENLSSAADITKDPQLLTQVQELLQRQATGVGATVAGIKMEQNETAPQFVSRVISKFANEPLSAGAGDFLDNLKARSQADVNAALGGLRGSVLGQAEAQASIFDAESKPEVANAIRTGAKKYYQVYLENALGKQLSPDQVDDLSGFSISHPRLSQYLKQPGADKSPETLQAAGGSPFATPPGAPAPALPPAAAPTIPGAATPPAAPKTFTTKSGVTYSLAG